jgi:hypothetical protein
MGVTPFKANSGSGAENALIRQDTHCAPERIRVRPERNGFTADSDRLLGNKKLTYIQNEP